MHQSKHRLIQFPTDILKVTSCFEGDCSRSAEWAAPWPIKSVIQIDLLPVEKHLLYHLLKLFFYLHFENHVSMHDFTLRFSEMSCVLYDISAYIIVILEMGQE